MATQSEFKIEPIKTALAMGNYAEARRLRTQLWRDALTTIHNYTMDAKKWPDYDPVMLVCEVSDSALLVDKLDIPEEP